MTFRTIPRRGYNSFLSNREQYVNDNPAAITPTIGSELLVNNTLASWGGSPSMPTTWSNSGHNGTTLQITQVGTGLGNGGGGTGSVNYFAQETGPILLEQVVCTIGQWYQAETIISFNSGGGVRVSPGGTLATYTGATGTFTQTARATGTSFTSRNNGGSVGTPVNATVDNYSCKLLTNLYSQLDTHNSLFWRNHCQFTITTDMQAGVFQRHTSGDLVLSYYNRVIGQLVMMKIVSGTVTQIGNSVQTYSATKAVWLSHTVADTWLSGYDTPSNINANLASSLISVSNVTDANLDLCTENGIFSTYASNTPSNYRGVKL